MSDRSFYFEITNDGRQVSHVRIYFESIEDLAAEDGIDTKAEDMDDETFYHYCEKYVESLYE